MQVKSIRNNAAQIYCCAGSEYPAHIPKRGGETYDDELLRCEVGQCDPDATYDTGGAR